MSSTYCPFNIFLDTTSAKARKSFGFVLKDYLDYTIEKGTLEEDLMKHGWRKCKNGKIVEPTYASMLRNSQLKNVLGLNKFSKYSMPVLV